MERRSFIKKSAAATAVVMAGSYGLSALTGAPAKRHITILHTNDTHSHIEPMAENDPKYPNRGGVARRATLVESIRRENPNTLLLDAGDIFQGTPYFNFFGGELEFRLMSMLKYDAATLGNHDFDNGIEGFYAQLPHAHFDFVSSNYDFTNTILEGKVKPYRVFSKDGVRIGVFGLGIELQGLVNPLLYKETKYLDPIEITTDITGKLREEEKCDLVICLSHLGYSYNGDKISDLKIAEQTIGIDLIIGGHTHTFLPEPTVAQNAKGENVLINQVGFGGINLGRIDFYLDEKRDVTSQASVIGI